MSNCCDANGNCTQDRDCPVRVATYRAVMRAADPLPASMWRAHVRRMAYWMLMAIIGLTVWPMLGYLFLRA